MDNVRQNLNVLVTVTWLTLFSFGCSSVGPSDPSEQNVASAENSIEIECGAQILVVQTDKLSQEQRKHLEKLETRCRIDNAARKLDIPRGIDTVDYDEQRGLRCDEDCENNYPNRRR